MMKTLDDPEFDATISLRDAYCAMAEFLSAYHRRGESSTAALLGDIQIGIWKDRGSADPAQLDDFLIAVKKVADGKTGSNQASQDTSLRADPER